MIINLPDEVEYIINKLYENGYDGYAVGGCIRDSLLDRCPGDWDIATCAPSKIISQIFNKHKVKPTGLKYGTVTVIVNDKSFEVTTYRMESEYSDSRRPDSVKFTKSLAIDLKRRDFTINAMAFNTGMGLVDLFGGWQDIKDGIIRCVGNPEKRFSEDALRILRALRFSAELGFEVELKTREALINNSFLLQKISRERIRIELNKILLSDSPEIMKELIKPDIIKYIFPELFGCDKSDNQIKYYICSEDVYLFKAVKYVERKLVLRLAAFIYELFDFYIDNNEQAGILQNILQNLRYDKETENKVSVLVLNFDKPIEANRKSVCRWLKKTGILNFEYLLKVKEAYINVQNRKYFGKWEKEKKELNRIWNIFDNIIKTSQCFNRENLAVNGNDLMELGFSEGSKIGKTLDRLVDLVIEKPYMNTRKNLIQYLKEQQV